MNSGIIFASLTALLWAILAIILKYSLNFASVGTVVGFRFLFALTLLGMIFQFRSQGFPKKLFNISIKPSPLFGILAGVFLGLNYYSYMKGVELTSPGNTQILIQLGPILLILSGIFFFKEKCNSIQALGLTLSGIGFSVFFWDQLSQLTENQSIYYIGNTWILFSAFTWVIYAIIQKKMLSSWTPQEINFLIYLAAMLLFVPAVDFSEFKSLSLNQWGIMIFLGLNTFLAYGALGEALKRIPSTHVGLIISVNPLLTLTFMKCIEFSGAKWISPERIQFSGYIGAAFVVTGAILVIRK